MAASVSNTRPPRTPGDERFSVSTVTFDNKYVTGGEPVSAASLGLRYVNFAICTVAAVGGTVNVAQAHYDTANEKILLFDETPAQVASEADVSNIKVQVVAFGK